MSPRRVLIALLLALLLSASSAWLVGRRLTTPRATSASSQVQYVAPAHALQAGEVLGRMDTELIPWPSSIPVAGAFARLADLEGRQILFPLAKDQPILDRDLVAAGSGVGLASRIPDGMRAVALRSDEVVGVAGFLVPGSHVDVLVTYRPDGSSQPLTTSVVQNVIVIAAGHQTEPDPSGKTLDATVVTLLLTLDEAQRAVLAGTQGAIHFVLRNGADAASMAPSPVLLSQLAGPSSVAPRHADRPRPVAVSTLAVSARHEIETVLGGDIHSSAGGSAGTGQ